MYHGHVKRSAAYRGKTYFEAAAFIANGRTHVNRSFGKSRSLGYSYGTNDVPANQVDAMSPDERDRFFLGNFDISLKLHDTEIVTYHVDDTVTLYLGGWPTVTTRSDINLYSPASVHGPTNQADSAGESRLYVVHATDPLTPPRGRHCRICKGTGKYSEITRPRKYQPYHRDYNSDYRENGWAEHDVCYQCEGEGWFTIGLVPMPTPFGAYEHLTVDADGRVIASDEKITQAALDALVETARRTAARLELLEPAA